MKLSLIQDIVKARSEEMPDATALAMSDSSLSYAELERLSNQFARMIMCAGCKKDDRICLLMEKKIEIFISLIGCMKAGCICIPVSSSFPISTLKKVLKDVKINYIIANTGLSGKLMNLEENYSKPDEMISIGWVGREEELSSDVCPEFIFRNLFEYSPEELDTNCSSHDTVYVQLNKITNSEIVGVDFTHQNILSYAEWAGKYFDIHPGDRICSLTPFHYVHFCMDLISTFFAGARLELIPRSIEKSSGQLIQTLIDRKITHGIVFPSFLEYLAKEKALTDYSLNNLRHLIFWDKIESRIVLDYCKSNLNGTTITNLYSTLKKTGSPEDHYDVNPHRNGNGNDHKVSNDDKINEEVLVIGHDMTSQSEYDPDTLGLKLIGLKLKGRAMFNGASSKLLKGPNPFKLDFYN